MLIRKFGNNKFKHYLEVCKFQQ